MTTVTVERPEPLVTITLTESEAKTVLKVIYYTGDRPLYEIRSDNDAVYPFIKALEDALDD